MLRSAGVLLSISQLAVGVTSRIVKLGQNVFGLTSKIFQRVAKTGRLSVQPPYLLFQVLTFLQKRLNVRFVFGGSLRGLISVIAVLERCLRRILRASLRI